MLFKSSIKIYIRKNECVDYSYNNILYSYEYNKICYISCPNGTYISPKNNNLCVKDFKCDKYYNYDKTDCLEEVDKCPIKCNECSLESISQNLCI